VAYTVRDLVYIGTFGALWGVVEMTLGDLLHAIGPIPLKPLRGSFIAAIGIGIALVGRLFVPRRGAILMTGIIAMLLKALSPSGQAVLSVMIAVLAESLLAELGLLLLGQERRLGFVLAGALATGWNMFHPLISRTLLYGQRLVEVSLSILQQGASLLGLDPSVAWLVVGVLLAANMSIGAAGGWVAWSMGGEIQQRLGHRSQPSPPETEGKQR
jgi:ABC-type thiamin/hydroxymethylpyrimidine transport system permease subunit